MDKTLRLLIFIIFFIPHDVFCQSVLVADLDSIYVVKKHARLKLVSKQFGFTEGAAVDKKGNIFFTDQPNNKIWEYDIHRKLSVFMNTAGRSNGMYFSKEGKLISCADEHNQIWAISPQKKVIVLLQNYHGQLFNGPNDLWVNNKDGIYFTDPYYQRDYWARTKSELKYQALYYLAKGKSEAVLMDSTLVQPNGIVGTPNGKYLYVSDLGDDKTFRYLIGKDGSLSNRMLYVTQGSDGMTLDDKGNLYLCGKGVTIYNNKGIKIGNIPVPARWVGNICFGGKNRSTLFITASEYVYTLQMNVKGVE